MDSSRAAVERFGERRNLRRHRLDGLRADPNQRRGRIEIDMARSRFELAGDKAEQGGLAVAVGPDDAGPSRARG